MTPVRAPEVMDLRACDMSTQTISQRRALSQLWHTPFRYPERNDSQADAPFAWYESWWTIGAGYVAVAALIVWRAFA